MYGVLTSAILSHRYREWFRLLVAIGRVIIPRVVRDEQAQDYRQDDEDRSDENPGQHEDSTGPMSEDQQRRWGASGRVSRPVNATP